MQSNAKHVIQLFMHTLTVQDIQMTGTQIWMFYTTKAFYIYSVVYTWILIVYEWKKRAINFTKGFHTAPTVCFILNRGSGNWVQLTFRKSLSVPTSFLICFWTHSQHSYTAVTATARNTKHYLFFNHTKKERKNKYNY